MLSIHKRASVKGIFWLTEEFKWVAVKTGTITRLSTFFSLALHCVTCLYGLLNWAKPGYGSIILQSWLNLSILEWCSREDVTQYIKWLNIPRLTVWRILGTIIVCREMHFIFQKAPSVVPTTWSSRYCLASRLSVIFPSVVSIIFAKYSRYSLNCHDHEFHSPNDDLVASQTAAWDSVIDWKWMFSK